MILKRKVRVLVTLRTRLWSKGCDIKSIHEKERIFFPFCQRSIHKCVDVAITGSRSREKNYVTESSTYLYKIYSYVCVYSNNNIGTYLLCIGSVCSVGLVL